ncbi:MAG: hypothetical protein ACREP7_17205 [Lysobacter sp.]
MTSMIRNLSPLLLAALAGLTAPAAFAQNGSPPGSHPPDSGLQRTEPPVNDMRGDTRVPSPGEAIGPTKFAELDSNGDHKISRDEAALDSLIAANFTAIDLDHDGSISLSEYQAAQTKPARSQAVSEK